MLMIKLREEQLQLTVFSATLSSSCAYYNAVYYFL